jgi:hypothetical protein
MGLFRASISGSSQYYIACQKSGPVTLQLHSTDKPFSMGLPSAEICHVVQEFYKAQSDYNQDNSLSAPFHDIRL